MKFFSWLGLVLAAGLLSTSAQSSESVPAPAVVNGYLTAVLRSSCTSAPRPPPPIGEIAVGPGYVIMTVADGDPLDYQHAQTIVTDAIFESLMPLYCGLPRGGCVTSRVQWNLVTYDAAGNPKISGSPTSGPGPHYCAVTNGYITAVIRGESAVVPSPPPVGQVAVGVDSVIMTLADADPLDLGAAQSLATDAVFEALMKRYCALPRGAGNGLVSARAQWTVATYDVDGNLHLSGCAPSGCEFHECLVSKGFITAVLRCGSAPASPPPVGGIAVGPDYVIMTVADGDPLDYETARRFATDAVFESLMPFYCALAESSAGGCATNRGVQWNLMTYDAGGNWKVSGSPTSGSAYHYFSSCSLTRQELIENILVWVNVDVAAGILSRGNGHRLSGSLDAALRQLARGNTRKALDSVQGFLIEVNAMVAAGRLPAAAAQPLLDGAQAVVAQF
jgi:hypothetical protein